MDKERNRLIQPSLRDELPWAILGFSIWIWCAIAIGLFVSLSGCTLAVKAWPPQLTATAAGSFCVERASVLGLRIDEMEWGEVECEAEPVVEPER